MVGPSSTVDQNILPVQAYFNLDGSFNTFIGQGQPFVVSATESIGIINTSVSGTFYPTFTAVNTGQVTTLSVTSSVYKFNPGTGELSAPFFDGFLNGTASEANNIAGGASSQLLYQTSANTTGFVPNGISGQFLVSNGTSAPSWSSVATSVTIVDQTSSSSTFYPLFYSATSGSTNTVETSSTKLQYVPSTGTFTSTVFSGSGASLTNIPNSALTNSSFTLGSTSISLGSTTTTIAGLTSVTSTTFVGALTGNASTATTATTATNATNIGITDNTSSIATWYPTIVSNTTGNLPATTSSTKLSFVPSTGTLAVANLNLTNALGIAYGGTNSTATPTAGGIGYGTGTAHAYSAVGTSGQVLTSAGAGVPIWTTPTTGTVTSVTGTAPVVSSGGNTPVISMAKATTSVDGYLSATDWTTFNNKSNTTGTVTSVAATVPSFLSVSGSPITTSGTLALTYSGTALPVLNGGTGVTTSTGSGSTVLNTSPTLTTPAITGGTIDNTPIGATTPSTGAFTTLKASGNTLLNQSYDQGTGVLQVTGQSTFNGTVVDKTLSLQGGNNLALSSSNTTNATYWSAINCTNSVSSVLASDNVNYYNLVTATSSANRNQQNTISTTIGSTYTITFELYKGTSNYGGISVVNATSGAIFNLNTGSVVSVTGTGATASISRQLSNGAYRCSITVVPTAVSINIGFGVSDGSTYASGFYSSASSGTVYGTFSQAELGTQASAYTPTTTTAITTTNNISVPSGGVYTALGSKTAPVVASLSTPTAGLYWRNSGLTLDFASGGNTWCQLDSQGLAIASVVPINWSSGYPDVNGGDLSLYRDAANTLAQRNSTNAQTFRLYNSYTSTSLGEWLSVDWSTTANTATIATKANGAGVVRTLATGNPLVISTGYTVATLPTGVVGMRAYVTNALAPAYGVAVAGGGAVTIPVFYNGANWICA